jgi:predicted nucleic acid-binding Zn ribbon protein
METVAKERPKRKPKRVAIFACMECGKKFYCVRAAERASYDGCPKCGGVDVDVNVEPIGGAR